MKQKVCAVFEIGKNQVKLTLLNESFEVVEESSVVLDAILDDDGFRSTDLFLLTKWVEEQFSALVQHKNFELKAINTTSYGGAMVHLDSEGKPLAPLYSFMKSFSRELAKEFREKHSISQELCRISATPFWGMLNVGFQLYWLKYAKKEIFKNIHTSLFLPQYVSFLFHKKAVSDFTSVGSHSLLWNFDKQTANEWVGEEHLHSVQHPTVTSATTYTSVQAATVQVGVGIQGSIATLLPFMKAIKEPFALISSKTWTICLSPFSNQLLSENDIKLDALEYLSPSGERIRASRLFAGNEHERQVKHLSDYFGKEMDYYKLVRFDRKLTWELRKRFQQATPDTANTGLLFDCPFVERSINQFKNFEEAYHQFMMDLVAQQVAVLKLAIGYATVRKVIVDGMFADNELFMNMLAEAIFDKHVFASESTHTAALGAAMVIADAWTECPAENIEVKLKRYE